MPTMLAYRLLDYRRPGLDEVPVPSPGPGEVLVAVAGAGLCRSDLLFLDAGPGDLPFGTSPPFTLGHEIGGRVAALGPGVTDLAVGEAVIVDHHVFCGECRLCRRGYDSYCETKEGGHGYGRDGGLAEFLVVQANRLVPLGPLDPGDVAPLADAGRTTYHAVAKVRSKLQGTSTALVIGAGGLGSYAVQWLRVLSPARVVVAEVDAGRRERALELGAHVAVDGARLTEAMAEQTGGRGADVVFDLVGTDDTIRTAVGAAAPLGAVAILGAGGGSVPLGYHELPLECEVFVTRGGSFADLEQVVALSITHDIRHDVERFPLEQVETAYRRLREGTLAARAVVCPSSRGGA